MYRVGWPFWKNLARLGIPLLIRVRIRRDDEAHVFVATSPDLDGLVVEAKTLDELRSETLEAGEILLSLAMEGGQAKAATAFELVEPAHCAA